MGARLAESANTKLPVVAGFAIAAAGLWLLAQIDLGDGYAPVAWALGTLGFGMGMPMAPATEAIMGALPVAHAGAGSAMNTTIRQVGGALGVAVLGSVLTTTYRDQLTPTLARLPEQAGAAAGDYLGTALGVAAQPGAAGG